MSCELIGISGRADGVGLEDLREAVGAFQRCVSEMADRHDGFVVSGLGNAALVFFGYPAAHEYDAEQAVRAGLELCVAVRTLRPGADVPMRCRVGIATGMAIIGDVSGGGVLQDREIIGDAPNLAGRLQLSAQPDIVAIEPATRRLIGNLFDCRDLGTINTTSDGEPLRIWQVLAESAVASRFEALRGSALGALVGRDEEIDLLLRRWARAKAGDGQVVLVSGEPGLGKSRLAAALEERLHAEPHLRLRYFCSPYHQDSALYPLVDQLGRAAGSRATICPRPSWRSSRPCSPTPRRPTRMWRSSPTCCHCRVRSSPSCRRSVRSARRSGPLEALIRRLEGLARRQPVVMVFEDAHWIDPTSRELLDLTVERVRRLPVLLIVTCRPEFEPLWIGQPRVTMLALNRLDRRDRLSLVAQIAGKALPEIVIEQIADRTDGVPLFVEELTKSVLESGLLRAETERYVLDGALPPFAIPTTLYASLLARLDRPGSVRLVAQTAAAIGREFPYALLRVVSHLPEDELQTALAGLVASELVFQRGTPPEAVYSFKHALVQDAAHGSLLRNARQQLHAQIAQALETHPPS
jgi:class 3 adenylate cyclase